MLAHTFSTDSALVGSLPLQGLCRKCGTEPIRQGRNRQYGQGYCKECHRRAMKQYRLSKMTEAEVFTRAIKKLDGMLRRFQ